MQFLWCQICFNPLQFHSLSDFWNLRICEKCVQKITPLNKIPYKDFLLTQPLLTDWPLISLRSIWLNETTTRHIIYRAKLLQSAGAINWLQQNLERNLPSLYKNLKFEALMVVPNSWEKQHLQLNMFLPDLGEYLAQIIKSQYVSLNCFPARWKKPQKQLNRRQRLQTLLHNYYPHYKNLFAQSTLLAQTSIKQQNNRREVCRILLFDDIITTGTTLKIFANSVLMFLNEYDSKLAAKTEIWGLSLAYQSPNKNIDFKD